MTDYLEVSDILAVAEAFLGPEPRVRDMGLIAAAVARPQTTPFGEEAYPDLDRKAAALLISLVVGHALVDGNKRLGWVCTRVFYALNGEDLAAPHDEAYALVMAVAAGTTTDVDPVAGELGRWRTPRR